MNWITREKEDEHWLKLNGDYGKPAHCPKCNRFYLRTSENFTQRRSRNGKPFLLRVCKQCKYQMRKRSRALARLRREVNEIRKASED